MYGMHYARNNPSKVTEGREKGVDAALAAAAAAGAYAENIRAPSVLLRTKYVEMRRKQREPGARTVIPIQ
jgi:hypothetical protein